MIPESYPPDHPLTYTDRLQQNTRKGSLVGMAFQATYTIIYLVSGFTLGGFINLVGFLACLAACILAYRDPKNRHLAANLITFGLFFSIGATSLVTGGITSSSLPWLCFVPLVAMYTSSITSGGVWFILCVVAIGLLYILPVPPGWEQTLRASTQTDRLIDTLGLLAVLAAAVSISERLTRTALNQLNAARHQLQMIAALDPLTRAFNRRHFFEQAQLAFKANHGSAATLVLFDIDHFKAVNDQYGHMTGDQVLSHLVNICKNHLRPQDILARFGGEEFIILMPNTRLDESLPMIFDLRQKIAGQPIHTDEHQVYITVSIGITSTELHSKSLDELIHQADKAMYLAKEGGRNRVVAWQQMGSTRMDIEH